MCVIITGTTANRPTLKTLRACERANPDGAGVAWQHSTGVSYRKGLTARQVHEILRSLPRETTFVAHFRFTTVGESTPSLCHPFPVGVRSSLRVSSDNAKALLFHNGTWPSWKRVLTGMPGAAPKGAMSDSRAMAWVLGAIGEGILDEVRGKFVVLDDQGLRLFPTDLDGWCHRAGLLFSNLRWTRRATPTQTPPVLWTESCRTTTKPQPSRPRALKQL